VVIPRGAPQKDPPRRICVCRGRFVLCSEAEEGLARGPKGDLPKAIASTSWPAWATLPVRFGFRPIKRNCWRPASPFFESLDRGADLTEYAKGEELRSCCFAGYGSGEQQLRALTPTLLSSGEVLAPPGYRLNRPKLDHNLGRFLGQKMTNKDELGYFDSFLCFAA
jgi:hypothetical protein